MTTFALVHGGAHGGWCWEMLQPELSARGHKSIAPDLPIEDEAAGAEDWARVVVNAINDAVGPDDDDVVVVAHSMGGLAAPMVGLQRPVKRIVLLGALVPMPGMSYLDYLATQEDALAPSSDASEDLAAGELPDDAGMEITLEMAKHLFYNDLDDDVAQRAWERLRPQAMTTFVEQCPFDQWPDVPLTYILMTGDNAVGQDWSRRVARERLGADLIELEGSHSPFYSRPAELADVLVNL
jgi:pimeloyl-ACP methyl ester carboxylesterase